MIKIHDFPQKKPEAIWIHITCFLPQSTLRKLKKCFRNKQCYTKVLHTYYIMLTDKLSLLYCFILSPVRNICMKRITSHDISVIEMNTFSSSQMSATQALSTKFMFLCIFKKYGCFHVGQFYSRLSLQYYQSKSRRKQLQYNGDRHDNKNIK